LIPEGKIFHTERNVMALTPTAAFTEAVTAALQTGMTEDEVYQTGLAAAAVFRNSPEALRARALQRVRDAVKAARADGLALSDFIEIAKENYA
jgi:hypothetical protein